MRLGLSIAFLSLAAATHAREVPTCRLDTSLAAPIQQAVRDAFRGYAAAGRTLPFHEVVVAPDTKSGALVIELVRDASSGAVSGTGCARRPLTKARQWIPEPDEITVDGVCVVVTQDKIRCSATALAQLAHRELDNREGSATLLFVLAHELGHIIRGDVANFVAAGTTLDRQASLALKFTALDTSCPASSQAAIAIEERADDEAREAMVHVLPDPPYRENLLSPRASLLSQVFRLRSAADEFERWPTANEGTSGAIQDIIDGVPLPASPAAVDAGAHRIACTILMPGDGRLRMPVLRGSHPDTSHRLAKIADRLEAYAKTLSATAPSGATQPLPPAFDGLLTDTSVILSQIDRESAEMYPKLVTALCTLRNKWRNEGLSQRQIGAECASSERQN